MSKEPKEADDHSNSEEERSEEFKNFENVVKHIASLTPEEVERVKKAVPVPKKKTRRK